jgi:hypothetical protein
MSVRSEIQGVSMPGVSEKHLARRLAWMSWVPLFAGAFIGLYADGILGWIGLSLWGLALTTQFATSAVIFRGTRRKTAVASSGT